MKVKKVNSADSVKMLQDDDFLLIDVRTAEEWYSCSAISLNKNDIVFLCLTQPDMSINPNFTENFKALKIDLKKKLLFICKAGRRSGLAAEMCALLGYECYNITDGIETLNLAMIEF